MPRQTFSQEMKPSIDNSDYKKLLQVIENVLGNNYLSAEIAYRMREKYLLALIWETISIKNIKIIWNYVNEFQ